jgi:hypothetical protein
VFFNWTPRHEGELGSGGTAPRILDLGTRRSWVVSFTSRSLFPQVKSPSYSLDRRLTEPQSRPGHGGEEKNSQPLPGLEPPIIHFVVQRYATELFRLQFICTKWQMKDELAGNIPELLEVQYYSALQYFIFRLTHFLQEIKISLHVSLMRNMHHLCSNYRRFDH